MELLRHEDSVAVRTPNGLLPIRQILGIGLNYSGHAREQGVEAPPRPLVFTKNPAAACLHEEAIVIPRVCQDREQVDFEGELAVVLGQSIRDATKDDLERAVLGYCCTNDVSARWWQKEGSGRQFFRGKSFDTFCPLGPQVVPAADLETPQATKLRTRVNGETLQEAHTSNMIFSISQLLLDLSRGTTLLAGTVILTGTPAGVGFARKPPRFLQEGDVVEIDIDGIGTLRNEVKLEA